MIAFILSCWGCHDADSAARDVGCPCFRLNSPGSATLSLEWACKSWQYHAFQSPGFTMIALQLDDKRLIEHVLLCISVLCLLQNFIDNSCRCHVKLEERLLCC